MNALFITSIDIILLKLGNKKAFLKEKGLKCSLYGLVEQDSYYLFFLA